MIGCRKCLIIILLIKFSLYAEFFYAAELLTEKFSLENKLSMNEEGDYIVDITLINKSGSNIQTFIGNLPWSKNEFFVESIVVDGSKIPMFTSFISYAADYVDLADKGKLTGKINLSDSLSDKDKAMLKLKEFMIFWRYRLILSDGESLGELYGVIKSK